MGIEVDAIGPVAARLVLVAGVPARLRPQHDHGDDQQIAHPHEHVEDAIEWPQHIVEAHDKHDAPGQGDRRRAGFQICV